MMTRRVQLSLNFANKGKLNQLDLLMQESLRVLNIFVDELWTQKSFAGSFTNLETDTWLSSRMQQCLGKQALEAVKSQRKRHKKTKPVIRKPVLNLDSRFLTFEEDSNSFDFWIHMTCLGNKLKLDLPSRKHKHFNSFVEDGWTLKKSGQLRKTPKGWFLDVYFEKEEPVKKLKGSSLGLDCGYKKLIACSDGQLTGLNLEECYEKIARKQRNSKAYKKALAERDNLAGQAVNSLDLEGVRTLVVEGLLNAKKNTKGKKRKEFVNKLQYWSYRQCLTKLQFVCEQAGITLKKVNPAYTSQTCSTCGLVNEKSRKGETFLCTRCGMKKDADFNASEIILMRGTYSSSSLQAVS